MDFGEIGKGYTDMRLGLDRDPETLGRMTSTTPGHIFEDLILVGSAPGENPFDGPGHYGHIVLSLVKWFGFFILFLFPVKMDMTPGRKTPINMQPLLTLGEKYQWMKKEV